MIWSLRYNFFFFFIYPSPTLTSSKGDLWIFNQLFLGVQQRGSKGDISSGICNQPDVERLVLPLQNSRCRHLWLWFLIFFSHPSPFSLTSRPLRSGVKKCNISYRLLVWGEFLCIGPDRKVLTHSEGRTQRRSGRCVTWKPFAPVKTFFFPLLPVQNKWVWSLRTVSAIDFFIKQTFWLVIVRIVRVMMFSFHWSFLANHDREPAGTMARSTKKRKEKKAMRTAAMPVSFIGHAFFYLSEVLWISGAGNVRRFFELFLL